MTLPHDAPDAPTLLEAVREFLVDEIEPTLDGRLRYHLKVAVNVVAIVERELQLGSEQAARHADRLLRLGVGSDTELAGAIRSGAMDDRLDELRAVLSEMVADKLAVARPDHVERG